MSMLKDCIPRLRQLRYRKQVQYKIREQWNVNRSVFAEYKPDTQDLMNQLFEKDWNMIVKPKFEGDEEEEKVKEELRKGYWTIRDSFKYYSSISSATGTMAFSLTLNSYTDYLKQAGVYNKKTVSITDTDTLFFTTNKRDKPTQLNPGNALARFQFLEIILRIALKYGKHSNPVVQVKSFIDEIIEKSLSKGKSQEFRSKRYWNQHCDNVLRFHLHLMREVYSIYSGAN